MFICSKASRILEFITCFTGDGVMRPEGPSPVDEVRWPAKEGETIE